MLLAVVGIPARTAARRKAERYLKPDEADRVLRVARVVPAERNLLINPQHRAFGRVRVRPAERFAFDRRLFR